MDGMDRSSYDIRSRGVGRGCMRRGGARGSAHVVGHPSGGRQPRSRRITRAQAAARGARGGTTRRTARRDAPPHRRNNRAATQGARDDLTYALEGTGKGDSALERYL